MHKVNHERLLCIELSILACNGGGWAYAERHRWARGGMGAVSTQIKLWVGGPIAIHHAGTYRACQTRSLERRTTAGSWSICLVCNIGHPELRVFTTDFGSLLGTEYQGF